MLFCCLELSKQDGVIAMKRWLCTLLDALSGIPYTPPANPQEIVVRELAENRAEITVTKGPCKGCRATIILVSSELAYFNAV